MFVYRIIRVTGERESDIITHLYELANKKPDIVNYFYAFYHGAKSKRHHL